jgi:hypothetical protein
MKCFLIMPYGNSLLDSSAREELDALHDHIREAVQSIRLADESSDSIQCIRGDRDARPGEIVRGVISDLVESELAIAVLTGHNPNVFYELGVRHAVGNNTLLLAENEDEVPFDLRTQRLILYSNRGIMNARALTRNIQDGIRQMIAAPQEEPDNPVRRYLRDRQATENIRSLEHSVSTEIRDLRRMVEQLIGDRLVQKNDGANVAMGAELPDRGWSDLEGTWIGEGTEDERSHFYVRQVGGVPIVLYSYMGNTGATGVYHELSRSGARIYGRFRWLDHPDLNGFAVLTVRSADTIEGGWWYADDVPEDVRQGNGAMSIDHPGMNPMRWTRVYDTLEPEWVHAWFKAAMKHHRSTPS